MPATLWLGAQTYEISAAEIGAIRLQCESSPTAREWRDWPGRTPRMSPILANYEKKEEAMTDRGRFISSKLVYRGKSQITQAFGIPLKSGFYGPDDTLEIQPCDKEGKRLTGPATMKVLAATIGDPVADAPEKQPEKRYLSATLIYRMEQPYDGDNPRYGCCIPAVNGARHNWNVVDVWPCDENGAIHPGFNVSPVPISASAILEPFRTAPGYGDDDEWPVCDVCGQPVDPDEAHWGHEANCAHELLGICFCNLKYHSACCPDCKNGNCEDEDECEVQA